MTVVAWAEMALFLSLVWRKNTRKNSVTSRDGRI
jgi:hypothetical protein